MRSVILLAVVVLVGCGPDPDMPMRKQTGNADAVPIQDNSRVDVTRIGVFRDDLAYSGRRGVYVIRDKKTGAEFLGISGIGISELGSHQSGKVSVGDER